MSGKSIMKQWYTPVEITTQKMDFRILYSKYVITYF